MADLIYISAFAKANDREIAFAHFHRDPDTTELPLLRVLGWDGADTTHPVGSKWWTHSHSEEPP